MTQPTHETGISAGLRTILDNADAGKAFGPPIQQDGTILLPVARVGSRGGAGGGPSAVGRQTRGTGGGFGVSAKPLGVYVLRDGKARWLPAVDVNKIIVGGQLLAAVGMLIGATVLRARAQPRRRRQPRKIVINR